MEQYVFSKKPYYIVSNITFFSCENLIKIIHKSTYKESGIYKIYISSFLTEFLIQDSYYRLVLGSLMLSKFSKIRRYLLCSNIESHLSVAISCSS